MNNDKMARAPTEEEVNASLKRAVTRQHMMRWISVAVLGGLMVIALLVGGYIIARQQTQLAASCNWYKDIGTSALAKAPGAQKPSQLGTKLVVDARVTYKGQGCTPDLPPASADLRHWAAYYSLPRP